MTKITQESTLLFEQVLRTSFGIEVDHVDLSVSQEGFLFCSPCFYVSNIDSAAKPENYAEEFRRDFLELVEGTPQYKALEKKNDDLLKELKKLQDYKTHFEMEYCLRHGSRP